MSPRSRRSLLLVPLFVLVAFVAAACGSVVTVTEQQQAQQQALEAFPVEAPAAENGHQYGASLDEWTATEVEQGLTSASPGTVNNDPTGSGVPEISWDDLVPSGMTSEELIARFQDRLNQVVPGTQEADELYAEIEAEYDPEAVNPDLAGQQVRLAGFVAPLTYEDEIVTEFLLVPTFGACIHVPPPPPNQTVMVIADKSTGLTLEETWGAVWVEGTMTIESGTTDLGATSYSITGAVSGPYLSA